jgi:hypothetical protein
VEAVEVLGLLLLVGCAVLLGLLVRRRWLDRSGGTVDLSLRWRDGRRGPRGSLGWSFGVGRYDGDRLLWFKTFSLSPRPRHELRRSMLIVRQRRMPHGAEALAVVADSTVLECEHGEATVELAVPSAVLPGLLAWLEAASRHSLV